MTQRDVSYWPAKPGRVTKLTPAFERLVRGPVRRPRAVAEIEKVAELTYLTATSPKAKKLIAIASIPAVTKGVGK